MFNFSERSADETGSSWRTIHEARISISQSITLDRSRKPANPRRIVAMIDRFRKRRNDFKSKRHRAGLVCFKDPVSKDSTMRLAASVTLCLAMLCLAFSGCQGLRCGTCGTGACGQGGLISRGHGCGNPSCKGCGLMQGGRLNGCNSCGGSLIGGGRLGLLGRGCGNCGTGAQTPYTAPFAGPYGPPSPTVGYPYYTVRAPRDFLAAQPPSIGP